MARPVRRYGWKSCPGGACAARSPRYVGISTTKFDTCVKDGRMPQPFKIDACVIWDLRRLDAAFGALSEPVEEDSWADFV
jgi:hypothetical protein